MRERRPIWQRTWYVLTAIFAISLLVTALQWNTSTPTPVSRFVPSQYIQGVTRCLDSGNICQLG
jgi:hypothetical protein